MSTIKDIHLKEDQILRAVVDESDLPAALMKHLRQCAQCREEKEKIQMGLARLGRMGADFSPSPKKRVKLPTNEYQVSVRWLRPMTGVLGMALACLVIWFGAALFFSDKGPGINRAQEIAESAQFMLEISMLSENALPQEFLDQDSFDMEEIDEQEYLDDLEINIEDDFFEITQDT